MAKKGSVRRRSGGPDDEVLTGAPLPRPFADTTKLSRGDNRVMPRAEADLSFPRSRANLVARRQAQFFPAKPLLTVQRRTRIPRAIVNLALRGDSRESFCVRRKERREVLFALKRAGFGGSARKKVWRRNYQSKWRC